MEIVRDAEKTDPIDQRYILVVDDEPLNLKLFTLTLMRRGYRVLQATNGYHAFVLAHDERPDLIVMDVQLPEISGLEVTRVLKDSAHTRNIPVVIATAFIIDDEELRGSGCDGYITKPYAMKDFIQLIESLIERDPQVIATG
jgi:two-component system cell cycle response regulator DivK